jgi:membrane protein DedA with SNARE-associated domain
MVDWITRTLEQMGYLGVALLMFAENIFPPIPSELIMPFAGFAASRGDMSFVGVLIAGTLGTVVGALPWYWAGHSLGCKRLAAWADKHGRWFTLSGKDVVRANEGFTRHCGKAVLIGRLVPAVRTLISIPAGIAEMKLSRFLMFTLLGSLIWNVTLVTLGYQLGQNYSKVAEYLDPITKGILGLIVLTYLYRVVRQRSQG